MPRVPAKIVLCLSLPCVAGGCAGHRGPGGSAAVPAREPGMASRSAAAGAETLDVAYRGVGGAIRAPFRDLNIGHDQIPAVLKRAAADPYDAGGLPTCAALTEEVAALDLALGPDLDTPDVEKTSDMYARGASLAGDAALDAMRSAAVGYIPMRSVVRRLSGAEKLEKRTKKAILAGSVRRGFLKAIGMERGCGWPAAPLGSEARALAPPSAVIASGPSISLPAAAAPAAAAQAQAQVIAVSTSTASASVVSSLGPSTTPAPAVGGLLTPSLAAPLGFGASTPAAHGAMGPIGSR